MLKWLVTQTMPLFNFWAGDLVSCASDAPVSTGCCSHPSVCLYKHMLLSHSHSHCPDDDQQSCVICRQVMKESKGRVNPAVMNKILMQKLSAKWHIPSSSHTVLIGWGQELSGRQACTDWDCCQTESLVQLYHHSAVSDRQYQLPKSDAGSDQTWYSLT